MVIKIKVKRKEVMDMCYWINYGLVLRGNLKDWNVSIVLYYFCFILNGKDLKKK